MSYPIILLVTLAFSRDVLSRAVEEKIEPIEMYHYCMVIDTGEKKADLSPILLLHGAGGNHNAWNGVNQVLALGTKRRVCAVDLRNHGDSPWDNRVDTEALSVDVGHFLDTQGIKKVNIIGHSLGGKTAVHYALNHPERVDSIVIEDMRPNSLSKEAYQYVLGSFEILRLAEESIPENSNEDEAKQSIVNFINKKLEEKGSTERLTESGVKLIEIKLIDGKWHLKFNMKVITEHLKNIDKYLVESSGVYEGPALFIYGEKSPFKVGEDEENIRKLFPNATLVPVEGASHSIHGDNPKYGYKFNDVVIKFLNNLN